MNLSVVFHSDYCFHQYISHCKSVFYHIRDFHRIRRHLSLSTAKIVSVALFNNRFGYCNSLLESIAKEDLSKLQRI